MIGRIRTACATVAVSVLFGLTGCGIEVSTPDGAPIDITVTDSPAESAGPVPTATGPATDRPTPQPSEATPARDSVRDSGEIPDVCALLSRAEVGTLTGRQITQVDVDGAQAGDTARFCQWQQVSGQLAVFLSRTSAAEFAVKSAEAEPVGGVGEDAYQLSGHLLVLYGTVLVDVYVRGGSDAANLAVAKETVRMLLPRI
jgi:hypothetical protein